VIYIVLNMNSLPSLSAPDSTTGGGKFAVGDRCFSHYTMQWGTIEGVSQERRERLYRGEPDGTFTTWYWVRADNGERDMLDDSDGDWPMARVVPPAVATRYGYGTDPKATA
jgi:hypothetical protein